MQIITSAEFDQFCQQEHLKVLKFGRGPHQPKVFEKDNIITKLFYPKRRKLSKNTIKPQAMRFYENCQRLRHKGYITPNIRLVQYCKEQRIHLIHYEKIDGQDIRHLVNQGHLELLDKVVMLMADLHKRGIYFRCIHLENLLYQESGHFALIDITDVRLKNNPLGVYTRYRNIKHLLTMHEDKAIWQTYGITHFLNRYLPASKLNKPAQHVLKFLLTRKNVFT